MLKKEFMIRGQIVRVKDNASWTENENYIPLYDINSTIGMGSGIKGMPCMELEVVKGPRKVEEINVATVRYNGKDYYVWWDTLRTNCEHVGIPDIGEQFIYVIRDNVTGLFYRTPNSEYFKSVHDAAYLNWLIERERARRRHISDGEDWNLWHTNNPKPLITSKQVPQENINPFLMEEKVSKAKIHTDLGKIKTTIINFTGYRDNLKIDYDPSLPDWFQPTNDPEHFAPYPFPKTFEAVKMKKDKSKEIVEVIDLQTWHANLLRLQILTREFGSSVRTLYKKYEKNPADWHYIVSFKGDASKEIESVTKQLNTIHTKASDSFGASVMVNTLEDAFMIKMGVSLSGDVLEIADLTKKVQDIQNIVLPEGLESENLFVIGD